MQHDPDKDLGRREFLTLGTAALGALIATDASTALAATDRKGTAARPEIYGPVSLGYWQGSETMPDLDWPTALAGLDLVTDTLPPLMPASLLNRGDPVLQSTGVLLTLHGLFPAAENLEALAGRASLLLDIVYEPSRPILHRAWNLRGGTHPNQSSRVKLFVPVEAESRSLLLQGDLRVAIPGSEGTVPASGRAGEAPPRPRMRGQKFATRLTVTSKRGVPKLRRGFYVLGVPSQIGQDPPDWSGDPRQLDSPEFSCLLLSVEYGDLRRG